MTFLWVGAAIAQDEDRSRLIIMIEGALSDGDARTIRIDGFRGALNSTASLDRLTIADEAGIWLTIEGAELTWTRSALLRGALIVDRLAADLILLERLPIGGTSGPAPEATPFQLPDLPVSIELGALEIDRIELGASIIGFPLVASATGSAELIDGSGEAAFDLTRLDGPEGRFDLAAGFDNASEVLSLSMLVEEDAGGVLATVLNLPGAPSLSFEAAGQGPISALEVDLALSTDNQPRVTGQIRSTGSETGDVTISADIAGDLTTLLLPEYRDFFGPEMSFDGEVVLRETGDIDLQEFEVQAASLALTGNATIAADGVPERFELAVQIHDDDPAPIRLPLPGLVELDRAEIDLSYDRANGDIWQGHADVFALRADDLQINRSRLDMQGTIDGAEITAVTADIAATLSGVAHANPEFQSILGTQLDLSVSVDWNEGAPLRLEDILLASQTVTLTGGANLATGENQLLLTTNLAAEMPDMSVLSGLTGQSLTGSLQSELSSEADLLSGAFDLTLEATTSELGLGIDMADSLLRGQTDLALQLRRDTSGLLLEALTLNNSAFGVSANGVLSSEESALQVAATLANAGLLSSALSGPLSVDADLSRASGESPWNLGATAAGIAGLRATVEGRVGLSDGRVDLSANGSLPVALADQFIAPRSMRGTANFDIRLAGQPQLSSLAGTVSASDLRLSAPNAGIVIEGVSAQATIANSQVSFSAGGRSSSGGRIDVDGSVNLVGVGLPGQVSVQLRQLRYGEDDLYETIIETGDLSLAGQLTRSATLTGEIVLGETNIYLDDLSLGAAEPIPDINHVGESRAQFVTRDRAGLIARADGGGPDIGLDLVVRAPSRIFIRGRGLDAELGGQIRLLGTTAAVAPAGQFDLIRGRLTLQGQRFELSEATVSMRGSLDPYLRVVSSSQTSDATVFIIVEGPASAPELTLSSNPDLPEDEILARLLFGRSATSLSPVQAIQLVDAISGFAGGQGLVRGLRESLGLDDLDLTTDETGNTNVRVGRYISDNVYTTLEVGSDGGTEVMLNLDLTPNITATGTVTSDGGSSVGIFFNRDY